MPAICAAGTGSGLASAQARMPPVEVPAIRSVRSAMRRPVRRSTSASTSAGISPRIPPPSIAITRMAERALASADAGLFADRVLARVLLAGIGEQRGVARAALDDVVGRAVGQQAAVAHAEVAGLEVVGDERERRLLRDRGVAVGQPHADAAEVEQRVDLLVV